MERDSGSSSDTHVSVSHHGNTGKKPSSDYKPRRDHLSATRLLSVRDLTRLLLHEEQSSASLTRLLSITESATERQHARTLQAQLEQFAHHFKVTNDRRTFLNASGKLLVVQFLAWQARRL